MNSERYQPNKLQIESGKQVLLFGDEHPEVLLINTPLYDYGRVEPRYEVYQPPLGLAYIASFTNRESNSPVAVLDAGGQQLSPQEIAYIVNSLVDLSVVGINATTPSYPTAVEITRRLPETVVKVMGGIHPTLILEHVLNDDNLKVDVVFTGESEKTFSSWLSGKDSIPGVIDRDIRTEERAALPRDEWLIEGLDENSIDRRYVPFDPTHTRVNPQGRTRYFLLTSRTCPFNCTFCAAPALRDHGNVRHRRMSPEGIVDEIANAVGMGIGDFRFLDELFLLNDKQVEEVFVPLLERGVNDQAGMEFRMHARVDLVHSLSDDSLRLLQQSGVKRLNFGIERGSEKAMREVGKEKLSPGMVEEVVQRLAGYDIYTTNYFIVGFPGETEKDMRDTLDLARRIKSLAPFKEGSKVNAFRLRPYPGTKIFQDLLDQGYTKDQLIKYSYDDGEFTGGVQDLVIDLHFAEVSREIEERYLRELRSI